MTKRELFLAYDQAKDDVASAEAALQGAVKAILDECGKGPFAWNGHEITIAKRGEGYLVRVKSRNTEVI